MAAFERLLPELESRRFDLVPNRPDGPVPAIVSFDSEDEVIRLSNNTEYGLTGSVYTSDRENWIAPAASFMWAISISTASAPAPWWGRIPSAAST